MQPQDAVLELGRDLLAINFVAEDERAMIIAQAILFVNEPRPLRRERLDPGIEIQDVIFQLDMQTPLGRPGKIGLEDQTLRFFMDVDRRRECLSMRFRAPALRPSRERLSAIATPR